jgi:hypothetical protein
MKWDAPANGSLSYREPTSRKKPSIQLLKLFKSLDGVVDPPHQCVDCAHTVEGFGQVRRELYCLCVLFQGHFEMV